MSKQDLDLVLQPIERARGLPNAHYIDPDIYEAEKQILFFKGWAAAGFAWDVPNKGDAFPVDFLGAPVLLVRDRDGAIQVFQNTCRHRGMILISEPTRLKGPIRCPYHSWCYDLKGNLVRTPYVGGVDQDTHDSVDPSELGLFPIRAHEWQGVIFINMSGDAPDFEEAHSDLLTRWAEFDQPYHFCGAESGFDMTLSTNWKLAVENFCESYHLPWIHPELNEISSINDHHHIDDSPDFSGQVSRVYNQLTGENNRRFPDFDNLSQKWDRQSEYVSCFPNVLFGVHRDHAYAMLLMPQGPEQTLERVALTYASPDVAGPEWESMRQRNAELWQNVFAEDIGVVEGMQKGRHGPQFDGGKFSAVMDVPTHIFHKWVARKMRDGG